MSDDQRRVVGPAMNNPCLTCGHHEPVLDTSVGRYDPRTGEFTHWDTHEEFLADNPLIRRGRYDGR